MTTGIGQGSWQVGYTYSGTENLSKYGSVSKSGTAIPSDTVNLSEDAQKLLSSGGPLYTGTTGTFNTGASTYGKMAGLNNLGLKSYLSMNGGYGDTSLAAMNASRKSLGNKINSLIKSSGVKLGKDEKITISVDADNKIRVGGIKDKKKLEAIQDALDKDKKLAKDLKSHVANGKITEAAQKQEAYAKMMGQMGVDTSTLDLDDMFTNRGLRTYVLDEYLQENAGLGLADLQYEKLADGTVSLIGVPEELTSLFTDDPSLASTVTNMLENGEVKSDFKVSFEFANGALSDSSTDNAARDKIEGIKAKMMGTVDADGNRVPGEIDKMRERLEAQGVDPDDPEYKKLMQMLARGFSIDLKQNGEYEIAGTENMNPRWVDLLKTVVERSLSAWADDPPGGTEAPTEPRTRTMSDIAEAFLEQHRFEHGDVDEHEHVVRVNFAGGRSAVDVLSPAADREQDLKNQKNADALGKELRGVLEEAGVEVGAGIEVEIDESGKITVLGDPNNPDVKAAQQVLDQFMREGKSLRDESGTEAAEDRKAAAEAARTRRDAKGSTSIYEEQNHNKFVRDALDKFSDSLPDGPEANTVANAQAKSAYMAALAKTPKYEGGTRQGSLSTVVSGIERPRYGENSDALVNPGSFRMDEDSYGADAKGLYRKLMDGMGQFHDGLKRASYRFTIA